MKNLTKSKIVSILKQIPDPELNVSIWDLGLIYEIKEIKGEIEILMTLTSIGCPLFSQIEEEIKLQVKKIPGIKSVIVNLTFDPPWNLDKISKEAKAQLGI